MDPLLSIIQPYSFKFRIQRNKQLTVAGFFQLNVYETENMYLFLRVHENKTKTGRWGNSVLVAVVELETKYGLYFVELKLYTQLTKSVMFSNSIA